MFERRPGLEVLRALIAGELPRPPIHHLTGLALDRGGGGGDRRGSALQQVALDLGRHGAGRVHGDARRDRHDRRGLQHHAAADTAVAALDFKVNYLRPVFPDGNDLTARARILHRGRTLVIAAAEIINAEGKQVALATGSSMYLPGRPANLIGVELGSGSSDPEDDPGS